MNGFITFAPDVLYGGRSADNVTLEDTGFLQFLERIDATCLADGGFSLSSRAPTPYTKTQLFHDADLEEQRFDYNAHHAFFRACAEHPFAAPRLGKYHGMMTHWKTRDFKLLRGALGLACAAQNANTS